MRNPSLSIRRRRGSLGLTHRKAARLDTWRPLMTDSFHQAAVRRGSIAYCRANKNPTKWPRRNREPISTTRPIDAEIKKNRQPFADGGGFSEFEPSPAPIRRWL